MCGMNRCPRDFTFVCPTEILAFNDSLPDFAQFNTSVLGTSYALTSFHISVSWYRAVLYLLAVSTDSKYTHFAWASQSRKEGGLGPNLKIPLIADQSMRISREYGVLLEEEGFSLRGTFIIDPSGVIKYDSALYIVSLQYSS